MPFSAAPHGDILSILIQFSLLLFLAKILGEVMTRIGQPSVIGEILAGVILGPSILGSLLPELSRWWLPSNDTQGYLLELVSMFGAIFLMMLTGMETDFKLIRSHAKTALGVSLSGIAATMAAGFTIGMIMPESLLADSSRRIIFALFLATALAISSIPVIATVLMEMKLIRRDIGQTIIAAGMSDDTIGWIVLTVVLGIAEKGSITLAGVGSSAGVVLVFILLSFTAGKYFIKKIIEWIQDHLRLQDRILTVSVIFVMLWGAFAEALHLEVVLGAFIVGIILGQIPRIPDSVPRKLESLSLSIFTPIFFATAGLKINIAHLFNPELFLWTCIIIGAAVISKIAGTYAGARIIGGKNHWASLSFGAGLNARGAMQIIIAMIGLSTGIISQDLFTVIILMAIVTSIMAPPALRWTLKKVQPDEAERKRLNLEEILSKNLFAGMQRVLLPVRYRENDFSLIQSIEAHLIDKIRAGTEISVTLLCVAPVGGESSAAEFLLKIEKNFTGLNIKRRIVSGGEPVPLILEEANKGYDLLILGAPQPEDAQDMLFSPVIDYLVRAAPCPTLVVQGGHLRDPDWNPSRILVPTSGTAAGKIAAEFAFAIASEEEDDTVTIMTVVKEYHDDWHMQSSLKWGSRFISARQIVNELRSTGTLLGVKTFSTIRSSDDVSKTILDMAKQRNYDLIILGTDIRPGSQRLFLGPTVERILRKTTCPVLIVNAP